MLYPSSSFWLELGNHLWQATLFGLFIAGLIYLLNRFPARIRFYIGWIGLLKFILPSALFIIVLGGLVRSDFTSYNLLAESILPLSAKISEPLFLFKNPDFATIDTHYPYETIFILLGLIWVSGSLALFVFWQYKVCRLHKCIKENAEPVSESIASKLYALRNSLELKCPVSASIVKKDIEPGVFGIFRPTLILTPELLEEFTNEELDTILIHELIHIKHRDNLWAHIEMIILCLFWFHPLVWWLIRHITCECENSCDEEVIKYSRDKNVYAKAIFKVSQIYNGLNIYGYSRINQTSLKSRIQSILSFEVPEISIAKYRSVIASVLLFMGISIIAGGMTPLIDKSSSQTMTSYLLERGEQLIEPLTEYQPIHISNAMAEKKTSSDFITVNEISNENNYIKAITNEQSRTTSNIISYVEYEKYIRNLDHQRERINRAINELKYLNDIYPSNETFHVERSQVGSIVEVLVKYNDYSNYPEVRKRYERVQFTVVEGKSGRYKDLQQISFPYNIESEIKPRVRKSYSGGNIWIGSSMIVFKNKTAKRKIDSLIMALNEIDIREREKFQELRNLNEPSTNS